MPTALVLCCTLAVAAVLALASAAAGAAWARARRMPEARAWADRLRSLETRLNRLESAEAGRQEPPNGDRAACRPKRVRRFDKATAGEVAGPTLIAVPELPPAAPTPGPAPAHELGRRFGAIWELADVGTPADAIARATGYPIGQVELILGLRRQLAVAEGRA